MALNTGDTSAARLRAEEALALHRKLGDAFGATYSVYSLGMAAADEGDFERARELFDQSLRAFRELEDEHYILLAMDALAWAYGELGELEPERRRVLHEDILHRARAQSNERIVALQLQQLASFARDEGRIQDALDMLKEGGRIHRDLGARDWVAVNLGAFAKTLVVAGRVERAAQLLSASEALRAEIGGGVAWLPDWNEETRTAVLAQLDEAAFDAAWEQGQALTVDEAVALALDSVE